jgi:hypothetical protein
LFWGLVLVLVFGFGAFVGEKYSGTCMFILMPYFAALAAALPLVQVGRFGAGLATYLPYAVLGFAPLFYFDWLQSHALRGLWAVILWAAAGPLIGLCADLAYRLAARLPERWRAAVAGAVLQAATFATMLLGLTLLYVDPSGADSHTRLFDTYWYFTAPWMIANGAFGGFTAWALARRRPAASGIPRLWSGRPLRASVGERDIPPGSAGFLPPG